MLKPTNKIKERAIIWCRTVDIKSIAITVRFEF